MRLILIVDPIFIEIRNLEVLYSKLVVNTLLWVQHSVPLKSSQQICISTLKADFCLLRKNCLIKWLNKVTKHFSPAGYQFFSKYWHSKFKNFNSQDRVVFLNCEDLFYCEYSSYKDGSWITGFDFKYLL